MEVITEPFTVVLSDEAMEEAAMNWISVEEFFERELNMEVESSVDVIKVITALLMRLRS